MKSYDVIVIGAGHNGLITAFYLAKSGKSVLVLEQKNATGGMALSSSHPEFKYPGSIYNSHFLSSKVYKDLRLKKRGIQIIPFNPVSCLVYSPDKCLVQWNDSKKFSEELAKFSQEDAKNYQDYLQFLKRIGRLVGMMITQIPPEVMSPKTISVLVSKFPLRS